MVSIIISVCSLIISLVVTGVPFYYKYIAKEEIIELIACDGIIRNNVVYLIVNYVNRSWKNATIVNSYISLSWDKDKGKFVKSNHECSCKYIEPILLSAQMHSTVKLDYPLPSLDIKEIRNTKGGNYIKVSIYTEYIGAQGRRFSDCYEVGYLTINGKGSLSVWVESFPHRLQKKEIIASIKL